MDEFYKCRNSKFSYYFTHLGYACYIPLSYVMNPGKMYFVA